MPKETNFSEEKQKQTSSRPRSSEIQKEDIDFKKLKNPMFQPLSSEPEFKNLKSICGKNVTFWMAAAS